MNDEYEITMCPLFDKEAMARALKDRYQLVTALTVIEGNSQQPMPLAIFQRKKSAIVVPQIRRK